MPALVIGIGAGLCVLSIYLWQRRRAFLAHAVTTRGRIAQEHTEEREETTGSSDSDTTRTVTYYSYVVTFADRLGREQQFTTHGSSKRIGTVGHEVGVRYNPDDPDQAELATDGWAPVIFAAVAGVGFILMGWLAASPE